jgi:O-antigen/teichoic acid export membrane protein
MNNLILKYRKKTLLVIEQFIVSGGNFLGSVLIAKFLGLNLYSTFATIQIGQMFLGSFHQAIIIAPLTSIVPGLKNNKKKFISAILFLHITFLSIVVILAFVSSVIGIGFIEIPLLPIVIYILLLLTYDVIRKLLYINNKNRTLVVLNSIAYLLPLGLIVLNLKSISIINVLWYYNLSLIIAIAVGVYIKRELINFTLWNKDDLHSIWNFTKWLFAKSIVQWFSGNYFIIVAGMVLGKNAIGAIRIVQNLFGLFNVILMVCENYLAVKSAKIISAYGIKSLQQFQQKILFKLSLIVLFLLIIVAFFSSSILQGIYGEEYNKYYFLVIAFSILYFFIFINLSPTFLLRASLITKPIFISYVLSSIFGLLSAHYLIESFGVIGVAFGLIGSQIIIYIWNKLAVNRLIMLNLKPLV